MEESEFSSFIKAEKANLVTSELKKMMMKGQIFYDSRQKSFLFREKENVVYVQAGGQKKEFKIPYEKKIYQMSLHQSMKYISYSIADNTLVWLLIDKIYRLINNLNLKRYDLYAIIISIVIIILKNKITTFFHYQFNIQQVILNLADDKREQRIKMSSYDSTQKILHFSWVYQSTNEKNIAFILCERNGIRLYKLLDEKSILKEQKYYEINCSACWYEPINQVLLTSNIKENGKLYTFFFGEKKSQLKYRGPEFYLEDNKKEKKSSIQEMDIAQSQNENNNGNNTQIQQGIDTLVTKSYKTQIYFEECNSQLFLLNIYSKTYMVFVNQMDGKIVIYHLLYEKILCLDWKISIPSDSLISLCIVQDLLLVNSNQNQISMIYDIKRQIPTIPLGPPQPIFTKPQKTIYEKSIICLGNDWLIDIEKIDIYQFKVKLSMIHSIVEGDVECFNILLRRDDPKYQAIDFLKKRIHMQREINNISIYFKQIFEIYKEAQKDTINIDTNSSTLIQDTIKMANKTKIKQGYTIIYPSDLQTELLVPIVQDSSISRQYIVDILSEYLRLAYSKQFLYNNQYLLQNNVKIKKINNLIQNIFSHSLLQSIHFIKNLDNGVIQQFTAQQLLIDVVLKEQNFNTLHFLIQYKILSDSSELAKKLINMSCPIRIQYFLYTEKLDLPNKSQVYKPGFQLGIDMLYRQKKLYEIVETFFQFGMFLEALDLIQRHHVYKIKAKSIAQWGCEFKGNYSKNDILRFYEYLLQSNSYINYQNSNQSTNNSANQQNKVPFTVSQLKDEFKKTQEKLTNQRTIDHKNKNKQQIFAGETSSPNKSQSFRRNQTYATKKDQIDQDNTETSSVQRSYTTKDELSSDYNEIASSSSQFENSLLNQQSLQSKLLQNESEQFDSSRKEENEIQEQKMNNQLDENEFIKHVKKRSNNFIQNEDERDESNKGEIINSYNEETQI